MRNRIQYLYVIRDDMMIYRIYTSKIKAEKARDEIDKNLHYPDVRVKKLWKPQHLDFYIPDYNIHE